MTTCSTFFIPITFLAGVYGMNFDYMPELNWRYGYPFALALMAVVVTGMLINFKVRGWLDSDPSGDEENQTGRQGDKEARSGVDVGR